MQDLNNIPLLDCPVDFLVGDASGKIMNEYGRFPCKIKCGVYAFMVRGTASATININRYEFRQNDALLLEPGSFLLIHEFSPDALVYYVLFSSSFLEKNTFRSRMSLETMQLHSPVAHLNEEQSGVIVHLAELLMEASNVKPSMLNSDRMVYVFSLLQLMFSTYAKMSDTYHPQPRDRKTELYQEYTKLVLEHYTQWHKVSQYAKHLRVTLPHLCSMIKMVSGRTAGELIEDALITDAKAQLKISNAPIKDISASLGFGSVAMFSRFFHTAVGMPPKTYRMKE